MSPSPTLRRVRPPVLAAAALLLLPFAGCLGVSPPTGRPEPGAILQIGDECPPNSDSYCTSVDFPGLAIPRSLYVHDATFAGIRADLTHSNLRIKNVTLLGEGQGLVADFGDCRKCTLDLLNSQVLNVQQGLLARGAGQILVNGSTFILNGAGTEGSPLSAIEVDAVSSMNLTIQESTLSTTDVGGFAIHGVPGTQLNRLHLSGVEISGFRVAVAAPADVTSIVNSTVACQEVGVAVPAWKRPVSGLTGNLFTDPVFHAVNVTISGCRGVGMDFRIGPDYLDLQHVRIDNSSIGIAQASLQLLMMDFRLEDNGYGILDTGPSAGRGFAGLRNGVIRHNRYLGASLTFPNILVDQVRFENNGHGWPDRSPNGSLSDASYGGLRSSYATVPPDAEQPSPLTFFVQNSLFEGNTPWGLWNDHYVRAPDNWWGSADGPRIKSSVEPVPGGGNGDNVTGLGQFIPFRDSPPGPSQR